MGDDLKGLGAAELAEVLRVRLSAVGGLVLNDERDLARELVRRARRLDQLEEAMDRLLKAGELLASQSGADQQPWLVAAALARELLQPAKGDGRLVGREKSEIARAHS